MVKAIALILVSLCLCAANFVYADGEWQLRKDEDNIQVYTRDVAGSPFDAVRTTTVSQDVRLASFAALILDAEACPNWAAQCEESYIFERLKETEVYVYTHSNMPFPAKDRDMLTHAVWSQDASSHTLRVDSEATNGILDEFDDRLRLKQLTLSWEFKPLDSGAVEITNETHVDPGSILPGWLTNMLLVDIPFETMSSLVTEVTKPQYRDAVICFVKEYATQ